MGQTYRRENTTEICTISELVKRGINPPFLDESIIDSDPSFYGLLGIEPRDIMETAELLIHDQYSDLYNPRFIVSDNTILGFYTQCPINEIHRKELYSLSKWLPIASNMKDFIFQSRQLKSHKDSFDKENYLYLSRISVKRSARGLGLGSLMLSDLHDYAKQHNFNGTVLHVTSNNILAQKLYANEGYGFKALSAYRSNQAHIRYLVMTREMN